jgi:hypothetical protein
MDDSLIVDSDKTLADWPDFVAEMEGRRYGPQETFDAWVWFHKGWNAGMSNAGYS